MISNSLRVIFLLFLCMAFAHANAPKCADSGSTLLWEINSDQATVHLFGSLHLGTPDFYPLPQKIEHAFHQADHVVFELDPRTLLDPAVQGRMLQAGQLPPGQRLDELLPPDIMTQLQTILANTGMPLEHFMGFRPWFISTVLATLQYAALGYSPDYGVEQYLTQQLSDDRSVISLETLDQQLAALQHLDGEAFLAHTLAEFQQGKAMAEQLVNAWRCADKDALTALLHQGFTTDVQGLGEQMAVLKEKLFTERNLHMAEKIGQFLENGRGHYFVVIGSGHYVGDDSIIELLTAKGYRINAVRL